MPAETSHIEPVKETAGQENIVLRMDHLSKAFGANHVLRDINLTLHKGENLAVFGQSGTGKSVLIKCIAGLVSIDGGALFILGKKTSGLKKKELAELHKKIGFLFQSGALYDSMTVRENLEFPLRKKISSFTTEELESIVKEALQNVGLEAAIDKTPSELSGGMRKRLGLARTLILKPEIMLYDEPTTGLDPITSRGISKLILEVQEKFNTSSIIITHDIECAKLTANRIVIIKDGVCIAEGTYEELENSDDKWIRSFFE